VGYGGLHARLLGAAAAVLICLAVAPAASAATPITTYFNDCPAYGDDQIC